MATHRIVSWNMAHSAQAGSESVDHRSRQWALLAALAPDLALLQECRPDDFPRLVPPFLADTHVMIAQRCRRRAACSAILARRDLDPVALESSDFPERERGWLEILDQYVAVASLSVGGSEVIAASVHTISGAPPVGQLSRDEEAAMRRPSLARPHYNDLAYAALFPVTDDRFVVAGDWATSPALDETPLSGGASCTEFFERCAEAGWNDVARLTYPEETRTFLGEGSRPLELDRMFVDHDLLGRVEDCRIWSHPPMSELSDHAPIVVDIRESRK